MPGNMITGKKLIQHVSGLLYFSEDFYRNIKISALGRFWDLRVVLLHDSLRCPRAISILSVFSSVARPQVRFTLLYK